MASSISEIKSAPSKFDGKIVRLKGWVQSGHLGVSIESDDHQDAVRLISPDQDRPSYPLTVRRDVLFRKFWKMVQAEIRASGSHGTYVELDGLVRILQKDGKPADEFYIFGQWPVEIITTRIRKVEHR